MPPCATIKRQVLNLLNITQGSWSITLVDDAAMIDLHARTMNLPTTTDVLTFDMFSGRPTGDNSSTKNSSMTHQTEPTEPSGSAAGHKNAKCKMQNAKVETLDLDTVICFDEAARRALELGHPLLHEVLLYAIHSLLHVRGYDDRTATQSRKMHHKEDEILTHLKIGPVYKRA